MPDLARPAGAHCGVPDPATAERSEAERRRVFQSVWMMLRQRIDLMLALPMAALAWLMIVPMLLKVDFAQLVGVCRQLKSIGITLVNRGILGFALHGALAEEIPCPMHDTRFRLALFVTLLAVLGVAGAGR